MGRAIVKLNDGTRDWYLEWSTVVDAPVTWGMTLDEMKAYRLEKTGTDGMRDWDAVVARLAEKGASWHDSTDLYATLCFNRAGKGETCLTDTEIVAMYCHRTGDIKGHKHSQDDAVADCDGKGMWK